MAIRAADAADLAGGCPSTSGRDSNAAPSPPERVPAVARHSRGDLPVVGCCRPRPRPRTARQGIVEEAGRRPGSRPGGLKCPSCAAHQAGTAPAWRLAVVSGLGGRSRGPGRDRGLVPCLPALEPASLAASRDPDGRGRGIARPDGRTSSRAARPSSASPGRPGRRGLPGTRARRRASAGPWSGIGIGFGLPRPPFQDRP